MAITSQIRNRYMFFDFGNCPNFVFFVHTFTILWGNFMIKIHTLYTV